MDSGRKWPIELGTRRGCRLASSGSKHTRESAESRTLVPDEAPPLPPLGLRVAAREEMEAERASPTYASPAAAGGRERRAASLAITRVRSSRGGAIFGKRSGGRERWPPRERKRGKESSSVPWCYVRLKLGNGLKQIGDLD
jgi:hypothetical protein